MKQQYIQSFRLVDIGLRQLVGGFKFDLFLYIYGTVTCPLL